jgi:hypothetical protein
VRGSFGRYEVLDFLALLFGYAISGERTLQIFFDRLQPFAEPFMAFFEREMLPHRSTLSQFLAAIDSPCLEAFRTLFATSSFLWGWTRATIGGLWDRSGQRYVVFDIVCGLRYRWHSLGRPPTQTSPRSQNTDRSNGLERGEDDWMPGHSHCKTMERCAVPKGYICGSPKCGKRTRLRSG